MSAGESSESAEMPSELGKNRAAFLFGFYLYLPSTDGAIEPMLAVCDAISPAKLMLVDFSLSRIQALHEDMSELPRSGDSAAPSTGPKESWLCKMEIKKLRAMARKLWHGRSELRAWYYAGLAIGELYSSVVESSLPDFATATKLAEIVVLTDRACACHRNATEWRSSDDDFGGLRELCLSIARAAPLLGLPQATAQYQSHNESAEDHTAMQPILSAAFLPKSEDNMRLLRLIESRAALIPEAAEPRDDESQIKQQERDQFLYEAIAVRGLFGNRLMERLTTLANARDWPPVRRGDRCRAYAEQFARQYGLAPLPSRPPGRPADDEVE